MDSSAILGELQFKAVRSSGAGGQHVNKVSSKVVLSFKLEDSKGLSENEKALLTKKLAARINSDGVLTLSCSISRSQHKNKALAIDRFLKLIEENLKKPKHRKKTKRTKSSIEKRLKEKKAKSLKKSNRRPPEY